MLALIMALLFSANATDLATLARTEQGYAMPCGVEEELDDVPTAAEITKMQRWARHSRDSSELEDTWIQLRVRRALRETIESREQKLQPPLTCEQFEILYRVKWDRAAAQADRIYGSSRKENVMLQMLNAPDAVIQEVVVEPERNQK